MKKVEDLVWILVKVANPYPVWILVRVADPDPVAYRDQGHVWILVQGCGSESGVDPSQGSGSGAYPSKG